MARKNKIVVDPSGKDLKAFQAKFGDYWRQFINSPAFAAGMQYLRNKKLEEVNLYTPEDVAKFGIQLQAELRGFLQLQDRMIALPEMQDFSLPISDEGTEYMSPEQEAAMQKLQEKFREETRKQRYA